MSQAIQHIPSSIFKRWEQEKFAERFLKDCGILGGTTTDIMASSSSQTSKTIHGPSSIIKINDAVYEFHRPVVGSANLELVFFHGFQAHGSQDAYLETWMVADGSACWLSTWLPERFPHSRILSVSYDSSTEVSDSEGRMDMYLVGENLARSIIELGAVGQSCPVVFVGHGVGGMVLKEVCCRAEHLGLKAECTGINPYSTFLRRMKGAFFFSTPQLGTRIEANPKQRGPLLKYYELLSTEGARLISAFKDIRSRYGWKTCGVIEANMTETSKTVIRIPSLMSRLLGSKSQQSLVVEEGSGRHDMDEFCVLSGEDTITVSKPKDRSASSYQHLLQFVQGILTHEEWALKTWQFTLQFPRVFMNMPKRVEKLLETLQLGQAEPSRVSLVGMGGIGKSTLAKELVVEIRSQFDFVCFVDDVKNRLKEQLHLHTLVFDNLYSGSGSKVMIQRDANAESLWLLLKGKKVLFIMDNVDSEEQISILLIPDWLEKGSRLVVTSRIRSQELMPSFTMHEVSFLSMPESESLFRAHVDREVVKGIHSDVLHQVVAKCDGLPLTVEVIGSYLRLEKDVCIWKEALHRLTKAESINGSVDDRLWLKLRVSFDNLGPSERNMFLDLAVFDKCEPEALQYDLHFWRAVWETGVSRPTVNIGLRNLVDRCFIRTSQELNVKNQDYDESNLHRESNFVNFVSIHQQLRDMGRSICRPSDRKIELCRGVWQLEDVDNLLVRHKEAKAQTESLSVAMNQHLVPPFRKRYPWSAIGQLQELRLLSMSNVGFTGDGSQRFSSKLAFLQMRQCFREKSKTPLHLLADWLESDCWPIRAGDVGGLHRITVLILEKCLSVRFPENFHQLRNLKILMINGEQLKRLPEKFGLLPSLQVLLLEHVGLRKLPDSFLQLSSLQVLKLSDCSALKSLPDISLPDSRLLVSAVPSSLRMLKCLTLEDLPALTKLPESFGMFTSLEELSIRRCSALSKLSESFGRCQKLNHLALSECGSLESLCESFGELESLSSLHIDTCLSLRRLPHSLGRLKELKYVEIRESGLSSLPASIANLQKLISLGLSGLPNLKDLPEFMDQIISLKQIHVTDCRTLESLPEWVGLCTNVRVLFISDCESLQTLPECLGQMDSLNRLHLFGCRSLQRLPESVGLLKNLELLLISECESLQCLPECMGQIESLNTIQVVRCRSFKRVPESLRLLRNLEELYISGCESLESLPEGLDQTEWI